MRVALNTHRYDASTQVHVMCAHVPFFICKFKSMMPLAQFGPEATHRVANENFPLSIHSSVNTETNENGFEQQIKWEAVDRELFLRGLIGGVVKQKDSVIGLTKSGHPDKRSRSLGSRFKTPILKSRAKRKRTGDAAFSVLPTQSITVVEETVSRLRSAPRRLVDGYCNIVKKK